MRIREILREHREGKGLPAKGAGKGAGSKKTSHSSKGRKAKGAGSKETSHSPKGRKANQKKRQTKDRY